MTQIFCETEKQISIVERLNDIILFILKKCTTHKHEVCALKYCFNLVFNICSFNYPLTSSAAAKCWLQAHFPWKSARRQFRCVYNTTLNRNLKKTKKVGQHECLQCLCNLIWIFIVVWGDILLFIGSIENKQQKIYIEIDISAIKEIA